jgi:hypothetical protein
MSRIGCEIRARSVCRVFDTPRLRKPQGVDVTSDEEGDVAHGALGSREPADLRELVVLRTTAAPTGCRSS